MEKIRRYLKLSIILFLLGPYFLLLYHFGDMSFPSYEEFIWVFRNTLSQSIVSAFLSLVLGLFSSLGLIYLRQRFPSWGSWVEPLAVIPTTLPVLFIILSILNLIPNFPLGLTGVVLVHSVMNVGLVAVIVVRLLKERAGGMAEMAWLEGASTWFFLSRGLRGYIGRDLFLVFFFVFSLCFSSFAVPLIVGGETGVTLEVLMYEKIRIYGDWSTAIGLALFQAFFVFLVSFGANPSKAQNYALRRNLSVLQHKWSWGIPYLISFLVILGFFPGFFQGWGQVLQQEVIQQAAIKGFLGSLVVGFGTGFSLLALFFAIALVCPSRLLETFLRGFVVPSSVLTGFALLLINIGPAESLSIHFIKIVSGLTLILLPILYRLRWQSVISQIRGQVQVARTLGASWLMILNDLIIPQTSRSAGFLAGFGAFWASGDFALSNIIADGDYTLALVVKSLISHYRLDMAVFLGWILLFLGLVLFLFFIGVGRVLSRKTL